MSEDLASFSVQYALKKGASYAETRVENSKVNGLILKNGNVEASSFSSYEGLGMRFLVNKKLGFLSVTELSKQKIKESIDRALRKAKSVGTYGEDIFLSADNDFYFL